MTSAQRDAYKMSIFWYLVDFLPILREMRWDQLQLLNKWTSWVSGREPLHLMGSRRWKNPMSVMPEELREVSSFQVIALMVGALWVMMGEDELRASGLMGDWGDTLLMACRLVPKGDNSDGC